MEPPLPPRPAVFVNLSNHPLNLWSAEQVAAARTLGLGEPADPPEPMPLVPPEAEEEEVDRLAVRVATAAIRAGAAGAFVASDYGLTLAVVRELQARGVRCFTATTRREVSEAVRPDGALEKRSVFRFVRWREYTRVSGAEEA